MRAFWPQCRYLLKKNSKKDNRIFVQGPGCPPVFHWVSLLVIVGLLLFSAVQNIVLLLALSVFLIVTAVLSWFWSWQSLRNLIFQLDLTSGRAFPDETVGLSLKIRNSKALPLSWLDIELELPYPLINGRIKNISRFARERVRWTTSIAAWQEISWRHNIVCKSRGEYHLGSVRMRSGDIFGIFPRDMIVDGEVTLLVYPRIFPVELLIPWKQLTGEQTALRSVYEDVSRTAGVREYQRDDPLKRIHWTASARQQTLLSRQYDSTTSLSMLIFLDDFSYGQKAPGNEEAFELAVSVAASLAFQAYQNKTGFSLVSGAQPEIYLPVSNGRSQLLAVLESLARVEMGQKIPGKNKAENIQSNCRPGTTLVFLTNDLSASSLGLMYKLRHQGTAVTAICIGNQPQESKFDGIQVIHMNSVSDLNRHWSGK